MSQGIIKRNANGKNHDLMHWEFLESSQENFEKV